MSNNTVCKVEVNGLTKRQVAIVTLITAKNNGNDVTLCDKIKMTKTSQLPQHLSNEGFVPSYYCNMFG